LLIYYIIVLPFLFQYLRNVSSWSIMSEPTLMISSNLIYIYI
jgi:hypothetical protein